MHLCLFGNVALCDCCKDLAPVAHAHELGKVHHSAGQWCAMVGGAFVIGTNWEADGADRLAERVE